ncbi:hypothetical protein F5Y18DRAFT_152370 [Xylariaceae sp. FL1019]|nr:hypothetical protein F5Y18DRAFT_152370 [Xylariaceae sp. FL1019]
MVLQISHLDLSLTSRLPVIAASTAAVSLLTAAVPSVHGFPSPLAIPQGPRLSSRVPLQSRRTVTYRLNESAQPRVLNWSWVHVPGFAHSTSHMRLPHALVRLVRVHSKMVDLLRSCGALIVWCPICVPELTQGGANKA